MITIYRIFQMLLGLLLSGFIFFILITYAGDVAFLGDEAAISKTLDVFLKDSSTVYFTGIPMEFSKFTRFDFSGCEPQPGNPPRMFCDIDERSYFTESMRFPILMRLDEEVLISRHSLDYGWTRLYYIHAYPGITLVFNPQGLDDETWDIIREVSLSFPDTSSRDITTRFDFCSGDSLLIEDSMGVSHERADFVSILDSARDSLDPCTATLSEDRILITISISCSPNPAQGVCVEPLMDGLGLAYVSGSTGTYVYKDPAHIAALAIGGSALDLEGRTFAERNWETKNMIMLDRLSTSAKLMSRRCHIIRTQLSGHITPECDMKYMELGSVMDEIQAKAASDPSSHADMVSLKSLLDESKLLWEQLIYLGCEARG